MVSNTIQVKNPSGLHLRPAGVLAKAAGKCGSKVTIIYNEKTIDCKSVLNIMAAGIKTGSEIVLQCDGDSEADDLKTLTDLIEGGLGE